MKPNNQTDDTPKHNPKIFDVVKPGISAPSSTTRPLVLTRRRVVQDPMVMAPSDDNDVTAGDKQEPVLPSQKVTLQPSQEAVQAFTEKAASKAEEASDAGTAVVLPGASDAAMSTDLDADSTSPAATQTAKKLAASTVPAEVIEPESSENQLTNAEKFSNISTLSPDIESTASAVALNNESAEPVPSESEEPATTSSEVSGQDMAPAALHSTQDTPAKVASASQFAGQGQDTDTAASQQTESEITTDDKKYFVHIAASARHRSMRLAVFGAIAIIIVALACVDAMLDAGILTFSGVPHTHFIKR